MQVFNFKTKKADMITNIKTEDNNTSTELEVIAEAAPLEYIDLPNGMPMFMGTDKTVIDRAIEAGYQVFYVLAVHKDLIDITPQYPANGAKKYTDGNPEPRIYKVVNNLVSKAIMAVDDDSLGGLVTVDKEAWFNLDPIPYDLVDKMDQFFRRVDDKLGTEAIVVLTYDTRYIDAENSEDGWGVIVPKQVNSGAHCNYDPTSVLDSIEDEDQEFIRIVGSAHSHPGMAAFASHTDHGDQVGNDGLHITFGWSKNGPTAFHIEMQVANQNWTLRESQAFGLRPGVELDPEIEDWTKMVEKEVVLPKVTPTTSNYLNQTNYSSNSWNTIPGSKSNITPSSNWGKLNPGRHDEFGIFWSGKVDKLTIPENIPNPRDAIIFVTLLSESEGKCPLCQDFLLAQDVENRSCPTCYSFLLFAGEKPVDIRSKRMLKNGSTNDALVKRWNAATSRGTVPIVHIIRWIDDAIKTSKFAVNFIAKGNLKKA